MSFVIIVILSTALIIMMIVGIAMVVVTGRVGVGVVALQVGVVADMDAGMALVQVSVLTPCQVRHLVQLSFISSYSNDTIIL